MRVTDQMTFDAADANIARARSALQDATQIASTGLRVVQPQDDSGAAGLMAGHRVSAKRFEAITQGVGRATDELNTADSAMGSVGNLLSEARQIAVQLSNATYSAADRAAAGVEVAGLFKSAIGLLNSSSGNRYIFGGNLDSKPPFDAAGNYLGDAGVRQIEIAPGVLQAASIRADVAAKGVGGGVDVLSTLTALSTALNGNNVAGIQATLNPLDASIAQISTARSGAGASVTILGAAAAAGQTSKDAETAQISHLGDADVFAATSQLALTQHALDATLTASAQSFKLTLIGKL